MPALTHVSMWTDHGWEHITADEASRIFPSGTVSANSKLFMCELCGQYVTLTDGDEKVRYFKHSAYEKSKDCPDRTFATGISIPVYNPRKYELPIKLSVQSMRDFSLAIGFLFVPKDILDKQTSQKIRIYPEESDQTYTYLLERLNDTGITYLSIGNAPAKSYKIDCDDNLHNYWPEKVSGINDNGSVFSSDSGNKLVYNSDVKVGEKYLLLKKGKQYWLNRYPHVNINQICQQQIGWSTWYVYEIEATAYEEDAAKFFLDLNCQLRDKPLGFQMLWPLYVEGPCLIKQNKNKAFIHIKGKHENISIKSYPSHRYSLVCDKKDFSVIQLNFNERQMLFTAGRTEVMNYLYFWKDSLNDEKQIPVITVTDKNGDKIEEGVLEKLPEKNMLVINAPYDGMVIISKGKDVKEKLTLFSRTPLNVKTSGYGVKIDVIQGLDTVWSVTFCRREKKQGKEDDERILIKLRSFSGPMIKISHNIGSIASSLTRYPKTKKWIYSRIREGEISSDALKYLERFLTNKK